MKSCCFSSSSSDLSTTGENVLELSIAQQTKKLLTCFEKDYDSIISHSNAIMTNKSRNKRNKERRYS